MYTKNNDPNYFVENPSDGNCGSFALNVKEWYISDMDFDNTTIANDMIEDGNTIEEIFDYLTPRNVNQILNDFKDEVRVLSNKKEIKLNEELIAFRLGVFVYDDCTALETDFHFKVKRNGEWMEKRGATEIRYCDLDEDEEWCNSSGEVYNGPIVFLAKKI